LKNNTTLVDLVVPVRRKLEKKHDSVGTAITISPKMDLQTGVKNPVVHAAQVR